MAALEQNDGTENAIRSVLNNETLSENEKCFLCLAIVEHRLYKKDIPYQRAQFTFHIHEDPNDLNRVECTVEQIKVKNRKSKTHKIGSVILTIVAPVIGALASIYFRYCWSFPTGI